MVPAVLRAGLRPIGSVIPLGAAKECLERGYLCGEMTVDPLPLVSSQVASESRRPGSI